MYLWQARMHLDRIERKYTNEIICLGTYFGKGPPHPACYDVWSMETLNEVLVNHYFDANDTAQSGEIQGNKIAASTKSIRRSRSCGICVMLYFMFPYSVCDVMLMAGMPCSLDPFCFVSRDSVRTEQNVGYIGTSKTSFAKQRNRC